MPKPTTKTRQELRSRFVTNAIPTEGDYADLIAAGLNQADDGILKLPDQPLGLVRQKPPVAAATSSTPSTASAPNPEGVLNFFGGPEDQSPSWQLQLVGTNKPGIALADQAGSPRLFLDGTTGNLGVGTVTPAQRLTVEGPWGAGTDKDPANTLSSGGQLAIKGAAPNSISLIQTPITQTGPFMSTMASCRLCALPGKTRIWCWMARGMWGLALKAQRQNSTWPAIFAPQVSSRLQVTGFQ